MSCLCPCLVPQMYSLDPCAEWRSVSDIFLITPETFSVHGLPPILAAGIRACIGWKFSCVYRLSSPFLARRPETFVQPPQVHRDASVPRRVDRGFPVRPSEGENGDPEGCCRDWYGAYGPREAGAWCHSSPPYLPCAVRTTQDPSICACLLSDMHAFVWPSSTDDPHVFVISRPI